MDVCSLAVWGEYICISVSPLSVIVIYIFILQTSKLHFLTLIHHFTSPWLQSILHLVILRMSCEKSGSQLPTSDIHAHTTNYPPTHNWSSECYHWPIHDSCTKACCHYVNYSYSANEWDGSHWETLRKKGRGWRREDLNRRWWMTWLKAQRQTSSTVK